jgi:hypothetical protein
MLISAIVMHCGIKQSSPNWNWPREKKESCLEQVLNCAIDAKAEVGPEAAKKCFNKTKLEGE